MIKNYECSNCGYPEAKWHIYLSGKSGSTCENCFSNHTTRHSHVRSFFLNTHRRR